MDPKIKRTARTVLQGVLTAAVLVPLAVSQAGLSDEQWPWLAGALATLGVIARIMQTPAAQAILGAVGLALDDPARGIERR
jgi:hypothetical protein